MNSPNVKSAYRRETDVDYIQYSDYELSTDNPFAGGAAYIEGDFVPASSARISMFDHGFLHSDITYTVFQVWHGNAFRLDDHIQRLLDGAKAMNLLSPLTAPEIRDIAMELVAKSELREAYVNISISRGWNDDLTNRDFKVFRPQVYMYAIPYIWAVAPTKIHNGATAAVARSVRRSSRNTIDPQVKNFSWGDLTRGAFESRERQADQPILLDGDGLLAEGAGFNVAIMKEGKLLTPGRNALPGITRKTVLEIAGSFGHETALTDLTYEDLMAADEVLGCTTAGGVWPFTVVDDVPVGAGAPGPVTKSIIRRFWDLQDEVSGLITPISY